MALRNFTRNLRMFVDIFELRIENKLKSLEKTVFIIRSHISEKMAYCVRQMALKKK